MPATLELLPRKEFRIILDNGDYAEGINGKFSTWALKRFCDKKNCSLAELGEILTTKLTIDDLLSFILCAVEAKMENTLFTEKTVAGWIDELGGIGHENVNRLLSHASDAEKKSDQQASL